MSSTEESQHEIFLPRTIRLVVNNNGYYHETKIES